MIIDIILYENRMMIMIIFDDHRMELGIAYDEPIYSILYIHDKQYHVRIRT